jgi:hypothetical protein
MNTAETPFDFFAVSYLTRIGNQSAGTVAELRQGLEQCSDASIFHHTFQTLGAHHFLTENFSNDFAQWAMADASRNDLGELLASLDVRDYVSIAALRQDLCRIVGEFCEAYPELSNQVALERFFLRRRGSQRAAGAPGHDARRIPPGNRTPEPRRLLFSLHFLPAAPAIADQ